MDYRSNKALIIGASKLNAEERALIEKAAKESPTLARALLAAVDLPEIPDDKVNEFFEYIGKKIREKKKRE